MILPTSANISSTPPGTSVLDAFTMLPKVRGAIFAALLASGASAPGDVKITNVNSSDGSTSVRVYQNSETIRIENNNGSGNSQEIHVAIDDQTHYESSLSGSDVFLGFSWDDILTIALVISLACCGGATYTYTYRSPKNPSQ